MLSVSHWNEPHPLSDKKLKATLSKAISKKKYELLTRKMNRPVPETVDR